jgi:hypothetical protein
VFTIDPKNELSKKGASLLEEHENPPLDGESQPPAQVSMKKSAHSLENSSEAGPIKGIEGSGLSKKPLPVCKIPVKPTQIELDEHHKRMEASGSSVTVGQIQANAGQIEGRKTPRKTLDCPSDMELDSPDEFEAPLEVRRSSRIANPKNNATLKIATPRRRKSSTGRRKSGQKKDEIPEIVIQASIPINSSRTMSLNGIKDDSEDERPKLSNVGKAKVSFSKFHIS